MRTLISLFLILTTTVSISQTKHIDVKVNLVTDAILGKITVKLSSDSDSLINCKVQIIDSKKNVVKSVDLRKSANLIISSIVILDLLPGNYTCIVYKGNEELYKGGFFKDVILAEPQSEPVLYRSPN